MLGDGARDLGSREQSAGAAAAALMRSLPVFACAVFLTCAAANPGRFSGALLCVAAAAPTASRLFMPCLQAAAAARVQGKPDIFDAAQSGDLALVYDHVTVDASCVSRQESL